MAHQFLSTHNDWDVRQVLSLVLPAGEAEEIYLDPLWGVEIMEVRQNGRAMPAEPDDGLRDDLDFRRMGTGGLGMIYRMPLQKITTAAQFENEQAFALVTFPVMMTAERLEIAYRARYAPGVTGADCLLVSMLA